MPTHVTLVATKASAPSDLIWNFSLSEFVTVSFSLKVYFHIAFFLLTEALIFRTFFASNFVTFPHISHSNIKSHDSFGLYSISVELRDNYHLYGLSCSCLTLKVLSGNYLLLLIFNLALTSFLPKPCLPCPTLTPVMQSQVSSSQHHTSTRSLKQTTESDILTYW